MESGKLPGGRVVLGLVALALVGLVGGYGVAMRARPRPTRIALSEASPRAAERSVYVHVGGAVRTPGLYRLIDGARVDDAVRAAGGPTDDADLNAVNLAAKVKDGDKVLVPSRATDGDGAAASGAGPPSQPASKLINLNTATLAELDTLPGIGPAIAQRIIDFRESKGGFRTVEDLLDVPGIGPSKLEQIKDHVTV